MSVCAAWHFKSPNLLGFVNERVVSPYIRIFLSSGQSPWTQGRNAGGRRLSENSCSLDDLEIGAGEWMRSSEKLLSLCRTFSTRLPKEEWHRLERRVRAC